MSFKRIFLGAVCPCLDVVCLTVGIIFKIEKQITWHKLTNPLLSPSAPQLYTCEHTRFHLFVIDVPPVSPLHIHIFLLLHFLHILTSFSYISSSSTSSSSFFTFSSSSPSSHASPPLHPPHPPPNPFLHLHILIPSPPPQFPSHFPSHPPLPPPLPHPYTFFKLHCFPTCASIPSPLCNLPPPF